METAVEIKNVTKTYQLGEVQVEALRGINLIIPQGRIVGLVGSSGSGKSTILNLIGTLDNPSQGEVVVFGRSVAQLSIDEKAEFRNQEIGFIFQNFNLIPVLTALENVLLPAQLRFGSSVSEQQGMDLLERVGLKDQIHQSVNRLSGGQMQRVAIARALMNRPRIILADEPTANLDRKTAEAFLDLLRSISVEQKVTVIIATHDPIVMAFCDEIFKIADGLMIGDPIKQPIP